MREWLQLFRSQTAPATVFSILVPYLLAGGRDPVTIALILVLGTLLHWFTFGHNSVMDYWYDLFDPNKMHHPLMTMKIKLSDAHRVIHYGLAFTTMAFVVLTYYVSPAPVLAFIALIGYLTCGHAYNDGLDKHTIHSWFSITACFTFLALYGWYLGTSTTNVETLLLATWAFLTIFYQIAWEGNLKDLWNPADAAPKFIREEYLHLEAELMTLIRAVLNTVLLALYGLAIMHRINISTVDVIAWLISYAVLTAIEVVAVLSIHREAVRWPKTDRQKMLDKFGVAEAIEFFRLMSLLALFGLFPVFLALVLYGMSWFVLMNRKLWGTTTGPKV